MIESLKKVLTMQHEATLCMLKECIDKCPTEHWEGTIGTWPFWNVAYHALCFADLYLSPNEAAWTARAVHPKGIEELREEYPSRKFEKAELLEYADFCREKAIERVGAETVESLAGESGFPWYKVNRLEMHFVNIRHVQHHTGQLSAFLRRNGVEPKWCGSGWK
jgi:hypothetical protein